MKDLILMFSPLSVCPSSTSFKKTQFDMQFSRVICVDDGSRMNEFQYLGHFVGRIPTCLDQTILSAYYGSDA